MKLSQDASHSYRPARLHHRGLRAIDAMSLRRLKPKCHAELLHRGRTSHFPVLLSSIILMHLRSTPLPWATLKSTRPLPALLPSHPQPHSARGSPVSRITS